MNGTEMVVLSGFWQKNGFGPLGVNVTKMLWIIEPIGAFFVSMVNSQVIHCIRCFFSAVEGCEFAACGNCWELPISSSRHSTDVVERLPRQKKIIYLFFK